MSLQNQSLIDLAASPREVFSLPESESEILAALDGVGYLSLPFNGLPIVLAVAASGLSASACERITESRLEVMQTALREAGFKPGDSVDMVQLAMLDTGIPPSIEADESTPQAPKHAIYDEEDGESESGDPYADEPEDEDDEEEGLPAVSEAERTEKPRKVGDAMREHSRLTLDAEIDAVFPAVLAWGIAGRGWGIPGKREKPTKEGLAADSLFGRALRRVLLDGFLRPIIRGLPTQAALHPQNLFIQEAASN